MAKVDARNNSFVHFAKSQNLIKCAKELGLGYAVDVYPFYGSDADAALYWSQRLIASGCDPLLIFRRLLAHSSEDVGLANSNALVVANSAMQAVTMIGMPEARIILSEETIYLANSPKSNSAYNAINCFSI